MYMKFKPCHHLAGLMDCSHKCLCFSSQDKIWKEAHQILGGSLVAWLVQIFRFEAIVLGAFLRVCGQMFGVIMSRMSCVFF